MDGKRISLTISEICQKLGIDYKNCNPQQLYLANDIKRLGEIYRQLKEIAGDLEAISERNDLNGLKALIHEDAETEDIVAHHLIKIAQILKEKND